MTELYNQNNPPLSQESGPVMSAPGSALPPEADQVNSSTENNDPGDGSQNIMSWGSKHLATAVIHIDDIIPPGQFKRYNKYVTVHADPNNYRGLDLIFMGQSPALAPSVSKMKRVGAPSSPLSSGVGLLNDIAKGKGMQVDTIYTIKLLSLQSPRACPVGPAGVQSFTFSNGSRHEVNYPFTTNTNVYIAFDVLNYASGVAAIVRFDVLVSMHMN